MMRQAITTFMAITRHRARAWLFPLPRTPSAAGAGWCMYSLASDRQTPLSRLLAQVLKAVELPTFEEVFPDTRYLPLDFWLIPAAPQPCWVRNKATVLRIFQKAFGQSRIKRIRPHYCGWEIIDDEVACDAIKKCPSRSHVMEDHIQPR